MSLDVALILKGGGVQIAHAEPRIFIRDAGQNREISRDEWNRRFPDRQPLVVNCEPHDDEVYSANITHNLNKMAEAAGLYQACWRPDELGITKARQLIPSLKAGLARLRDGPLYYSQFNPSNGWGTYEQFVLWVAEYLAACEKYLEAEVSVSR